MSKKRRRFTGGHSLAGLIPRIKETFATELGAGTHVAADDVATRLREHYPEYGRRQKGPFYTAVREAYRVVRAEAAAESKHRQIVNGEADGDGDPDLGGDGFSSSGEDLPPERTMVVTERSGNLINRQLQRAYKATNAKAAAVAESAGRSGRQGERGGKRRRVSSGGRAAARAVAAEISGEPDTSERRFELVFPSTTFADVGGAASCLKEIEEILQVMFQRLGLFLQMNLDPPRGILLHGPPGVGKTLLANAIAGEHGVPMLKVSAPELVGGTSGDSEKAIRQLFQQAKEDARSSATGVIVFVDEMDVIAMKRETAQREMERRMVAQLLCCLDELTLEETGNRPVLVVGATNRPDALDPAVRRAGRFDREISMHVPDQTARLDILRVLCKKIRTEAQLDLAELARLTPGYVGADLHSLVNEAGLHAVLRSAASKPQEAPPPTATSNGGETATASAEMDTAGGDASPSSAPTPGPAGASAEGETGTSTAEDETFCCITNDDFRVALTRVQPSAKREGFATSPGITWADVGALDQPRRELQNAMLPHSHPDLSRAVGVKPAGVLLYGPPGCGKTLLAKAVASDMAANFVSVKGPELLNKFVGESERAVRQVFLRARTSSPCVVFFDELDALCPRRGEGSSSRVTERIVNQLLTELDGFDGHANKQIFVIGATNRPDIIDPAMLRPGRFDKLVYVDLPTESGRCQILRAQARNLTLAPEVDLDAIGKDKRCDHYSGADLAALLREAGISAIRRCLEAGGEAGAGAETESAAIGIGLADFEVALSKVRPSVNRNEYASMAADVQAALK